MEKKFLKNIKYSFLEIAKIELDEAFEYYELQQKNLGYRFVYEVKNCIELICYYPNAWQKITKNSRRCIVKNFPYAIIYQILDNKILIIAVAHLHRKPLYWKDRIKEQK